MDKPNDSLVKQTPSDIVPATPQPAHAPSLSEMVQSKRDTWKYVSMADDEVRRIDADTRRVEARERNIDAQVNEAAARLQGECRLLPLATERDQAKREYHF